MPKINYQIIYSKNLTDKPKPHEKHAAQIIANYFKTSIIFLKHNDFSSPDLNIKGTIWEIKSPIGDGKRTISNNLRLSSHQSSNIILDLSRCKMHQTRAISRAKSYLKTDSHHSIRHLLIITKTGKVIVIL